jgi:predicted dithiol-disulfide oxidoreductase (DUF899 family)
MTAKTLHTIRFPGETAEYRAARDKLLEAEVALRASTEAVAAQRRSLPLGRDITKDEFSTGGGMDMRHVDFMWPMWVVFDTTPGRGDWSSELNYR